MQIQYGANLQRSISNNLSLSHNDLHFCIIYMQQTIVYYLFRNWTNGVVQLIGEKSA